MYTRFNKNLAIVTNFGCSLNCRDCYSTGHPLVQSPKIIGEVSRVNWERISQEITRSNPEARTITLLGGGDPFYNWEKNKKFFETLFRLAGSYGRKIDIQTRILPLEANFIAAFNKIIYQVDYKMGLVDGGFERLSRAYSWMNRLTKIRVVQEVDEDMSDINVWSILEFARKTGIRELTFREKFGNKLASENYQTLKYIFQDHKEDGMSIMWLDDDDRHEYYFLHDNSFHQYYFGSEEGARKIWGNIYNRRRYEEAQ